MGSNPASPTTFFSCITPLFTCGNAKISTMFLELKRLSVTNRLSGVIYSELLSGDRNGTKISTGF